MAYNNNQGPVRIEAPNVQLDSISSVSWSPSSQFFCGNSWSGESRIWEIGSQIIPKTEVKHDGPIFTSGFSQDGSILYTGGVDCILKQTLWQNNQSVTMGTHDLPIRHVCPVYGHNVVASGSWDRTVKFWSTTQQQQTPTPVRTITFKERVYGMHCVDNFVIVATADLKSQVFDVRNINQQEWGPWHQHDMQRGLTSIKLFPKLEGFTYSTDEGRIIVCFFNETKIKNYAFRTQRNIDKKEVYCANDISFHPENSALVTGGGDGTYAFWELFKSDKLGQGDVHHPAFYNGVANNPQVPVQQRKEYCPPVTALNFSPNGRYLAVAYGYDWSQGPDAYIPQNMPPQIFIHQLTQNDFQLNVRRR